MNLIAYIRKTYHPLFHLRKLALFRRLQGALDPDVWIKNPGGGGGMFVKLLRDASLIFSSAMIEPVPRERFAQLLREQRPDVFLDIGANVGLYSWHARRASSPVILMFEPDPVNIRLCTRTIQANRYKDIFVIPCAVSRGVGVAEFVLDQASGTTGSLVDHSANPSSLHSAYGMKAVVNCPTITLPMWITAVAKQ
jgi:FkbM family methyltransferase